MKSDYYIKREVLDIQSNKDLLKSLASMNLDLSNLQSFARYYASYYENDFKDLSFGISDGNTIVAFVLCYNIKQKLCMPSGGIEIIFKEGKSNKKLSNFIINQINVMSSEYPCNEISIRDELTSDTLSDLGEVLLLDHYSSKTTFNMKISFDVFSENKFFTNIRKSYKSLINWGEKNLRVQNINKIHLNNDLFFSFKEFHFHIAGRKTRSDLTWEIQYEMLKNGCAELDLAYLENELVAGSFFSDFGHQSIYFTGVYNRDLFHKGISHYLLYKGILQSYRRGKTHFFSLGDFDSAMMDDKWFNIQFFKKGFCKDLTPQIIWNKKRNDNDE